MTIRLTTCLLLLVSLAATAAEPVHMGIATGSKSGTYYQFGSDLSRLVSQHQIRLDVLSTRGSVENLVTLWDRRSIQLAIAQSDVLYFMSEIGDEQSQRIVGDIRVAIPLYTEETHLLAREGINSFADLEGKKVAIGTPGSGTTMTSEVFLELTGVRPLALARGPLEAALEALRKGEVDAMLMIAGAPVRLLQEGVSADDGLHLVSITEVPEIEKIYGKPVTLPAGTYAWQSEPVKTVGVVAGLMTLDFEADSADCKNVLAVTGLIKDNLDWLKTKGHEKWATVDLEFPVSEQVRSPCSALFSN